MKHQIKISASPGPGNIPAKGHPGTSFSHMNPCRTQSHLTVSPLQANSSDRQQDSVLPLFSHVSSPVKPFQQRGLSRQRWWEPDPSAYEWKKGLFQQVPQSLFYLSKQPFPQFIALTAPLASLPFWVTLSHGHRCPLSKGEVSLLASQKPFEFFPTRFNIRTIKYLKIKSFPPPPPILLSAPFKAVLILFPLIMEPFSLLPPYFSLFSLQLLHADLKIKRTPHSDSFAFTPHFP